MSRRLRTPFLAACLTLGLALQACTHVWCLIDWQPAPLGTVEFTSVQTVPNLGAAQGATYRDGKIYLYGDAKPGIIRECRLQPGDSPQVVPTGLDIKLTRNGEDIISHPTGLAFHTGLPLFLGNTVRQKGVICVLDWQRMTADRTLDNAVLNRIDDDLAVNGARPEYVRYRGRWLLATSDYGGHDNAVRLYDPAVLAAAKHTSDPGVLVASFPCGPFVQNLHWIDGRGVLLIIQNQVAGLRWRLTFVTFDGQASFRDEPPFDVPGIADEMEGFTMLDGDMCLGISSSGKDNVRLGRMHLSPETSGGAK